MPEAVGHMIDHIRQAHLDEPCPKCRAASGAPCSTPSGNRAAKPHADRIHNGNILYRERLLSGDYRSTSP